MKHLSFALENIKRREQREVKELLKAFAYHTAEFVTLLGIFALGIAIMTIL